MSLRKPFHKVCREAAKSSNSRAFSCSNLPYCICNGCFFQSHVLHLLSEKVVDAISTLPDQPHLVAQDRQVAHEARLHGFALAVPLSTLKELTK